MKNLRSLCLFFCHQASWYGSSWVQFGGDQTEQQKQTTVPGTQPAERPFLNQQVYKPNQFGKSQLPHYQGQPRNSFDTSERTFPRVPWGSRTGNNQFGGQVPPKNQDPRWQNQNSKKQFYTSGQEQGGEAYVWKVVGFTPCSASCAGGKQWLSNVWYGIVWCMVWYSMMYGKVWWYIYGMVWHDMIYGMA